MEYYCSLQDNKKRGRAMLKNIVFLFIPILFGCATPQVRLMNTWDYFQQNTPKEETPPENPSEKKGEPTADNNKTQQEENTTSDPGDIRLSQLSLQVDKLNLKIDKLEETLSQINQKLTHSEAQRARDRDAGLEHHFVFVKVWSIVLNGKYAGEVYHGFSFTGSSKDQLLAFQLMATASGDFVESTQIELVEAPKELQSFISIKSLAKIEIENRLKNFIIMPGITIPLFNYKLKFGFNSGPVFNYNMELRSGFAYDFYIHYKHSDYRVTLLNGEEKKIGLPSSISDDGYLSNITTLNINLPPAHLEANLILNTNEIKTAVAIGLIW